MPSGIKSKITQIEKALIIEEYKNGTSAKQLAKKFGFKCAKSIINILHNNNIITRTQNEAQILNSSKKFTSDEITLILDLNKDPSKTIAEISRIIDCDPQTIKKQLIKHNQYDQNKFDKYLISKFHIIDTEEKAYWIGFLAADASVNNKQLSLRLSEKDKEHLLKFKKYIGIDYKISKTKSIVNNIEYIGFEYRVSSKEFVRSLKKHNLATLTLPKTIPNNLLRHYIRGLVDGDGCFCISNNKLNFSLISSIKLCEEVQEILMKNCSLSKTKLYIKNFNIGKMAYLKYCGNKQVLRIANYLYNNSHIFLNRKKNIFILSSSISSI